MKQKLLSVLLTLMVGVSGMLAESTKIGDFYFILDDENLTAELTYEISASIDNYKAFNFKEAVIPANVSYNDKNYAVTSIGESAFNGCFVSSVIVPEGVTSIKQYAFRQCIAMTSISLPSTIQSIGFAALEGCGFTSFTLPASAESITFPFISDCQNLETLTVDPKNAKYESPENSNVIIEKSSNTLVTGCNKSTIPNGVTSIGLSAFENCKKLKAINFPSTLTSIGLQAFFNCFSLKSLVIPANLTNISSDAFNMCSGLESISVESGNTKYSSPDNCNAVIETATNTLVIGCVNSVVNEGIECIGANAFNARTDLKNITLPSTITSIKNAAFQLCKNLESITCKATTPPQTESYVFSNTPKATIIYVPKASLDAYKASGYWSYYSDFRPIGGDEPDPEEEATFACVEASGTCGDNLKWAVNCTKDTLLITGKGAMTDYSYSNRAPWTSYANTITTVLLPEGLTHVGAWSIYQFKALTSIKIPEGVTSMGYVALSGCDVLASVKLPSTLQTIGAGMFSEDWALESLTIPAGVTSIGSRLTEGCTSLTSIVVDDANRTFDSRNNCNAVIKKATNTLVAGCKETIIPNTVVTIGSDAFSSQRTMKAITIPNSVTKLDEYCFQYCSSLKDLVIPSSLVDIDGSAFAGCAFNTLSVNPANPKYDSRDNCNAIIESATNILVKGCNTTVIPDAIEVIGEGAFWSCKNLKFINLPASVDSIGHNGLIYCNGLQAITCYATIPPAVGPEAFNYGSYAEININPAIPVYVPGASIDDYRAANGWSYFTNFVALDNYYTVKALANHGKVNGTGTYASGTSIELTAVPDEGFVFKQWSNGETTSTIDLVVEKDTTVRALFATEEAQEEEVETSSGSTEGSTVLTFRPSRNANSHVIYVYKNGKYAGTLRLNRQGKVTDNNSDAVPARLQARKIEQDEDPETIQVEITGLELGEKYTFSIDSYDEEENIVSALAGSFTVEEKGTTTSTDELYDKAVSPRKQLQNGHLLIEMPDGKRFDATGAQL